MLSVEMTSMPASSSSSTSCQRFSLREPGTFVCASSSTRATCGRRASTASISISSNVVPRYSTRRRGMTSSRPPARPSARRPCVSTKPTTTSVAALARAPALVQASRTSCRRPGGAEVDAELPARHALRLRLDRSSARLSSSTLTPGSPRKPSERPSVCSSTSASTSVESQAALVGDPRRLQPRVRRRDVRVEARARRRDGVDRYARVGGEAVLARGRRDPLPRPLSARSWFVGPRFDAELDIAS